MALAQLERQRADVDVRSAVMENRAWLAKALLTLWDVVSRSFYGNPFLYEKRVLWEEQVYMSCATEGGDIACTLWRGDDEVRITMREGAVVSVSVSGDGSPARFVTRLATDHGELKRILESYYNVFRAALIVAERYPDAKVDTQNAVETLGLIENLYYDIFGDAPIADEGVVSRLVSLYEKARRAYDKLVEAYRTYSSEVRQSVVETAVDYADVIRVDKYTISLHIVFRNDIFIAADVYSDTKLLEVQYDSDRFRISVGSLTRLDEIAEAMWLVGKMIDAIVGLYERLVNTFSSFALPPRDVRVFRPIRFSEMRSFVRDAEMILREFDEAGAEVLRNLRSSHLSDLPSELLSDVLSYERLILGYNIYDKETLSETNFFMVIGETSEERDVHVGVSIKSDGTKVFEAKLNAGTKGVERYVKINDDMTLTERDYVRLRSLVEFMSEPRKIAEVVRLIREQVSNLLSMKLSLMRAGVKTED